MHDDNSAAAQLHVNNPTDWRHLLTPPKQDSHKYHRGVVTLLGGEFMTGATALAAQAAQRIGAGLVHIFCPKGAADVYRITNQTAITLGFRDTATFKDMLENRKADALLAGPGLGDGPANVERVMTMIRLGKPMVLDADAITILSATRDNFLTMADRFFLPTVRRNILLTPHWGEFSRLFPEYIQLPPEEAVRQAADMTGMTILLKGFHTHIASDTEHQSVNIAPSSWLATAGSGDVLSGLCLGLIAQGFSAYIAGCIASYIHCTAADIVGPGFIASDINNLIPRVLSELMKENEPNLNNIKE